MKLTKKLLLATPLITLLPLAAISCKKEVEPGTKIEIKSEIENNKVNNEVKVENKEKEKEQEKPVYKTEKERWEATPFRNANLPIKIFDEPEVEEDMNIKEKFQDPNAKTIKYVFKIKNPVDVKWKPDFPLYADFDLEIGVKNSADNERETFYYNNKQTLKAEGKWLSLGSGSNHITNDEIIPAEVEFTLNIPQDIEIPEGKEFLYKLINITKIYDNFENEKEVDVIIILADKENKNVKRAYPEYS